MKPPATDKSLHQRTNYENPPQARELGAGPNAGSERRASHLRVRAAATIRVVRSNPTGRIAIKVFIGLAGAIVVGIGVPLIPLPGPGWALVILGLAIWAIEFAWAKHLLRFTRAKVQGWTMWVRRRSWPVRMLIGVVGLVFIGAVLLLSLKYSLHIDLIAPVWDFATTR